MPWCRQGQQDHFEGLKRDIWKWKHMTFFKYFNRVTISNLLVIYAFFKFNN